MFAGPGGLFLDSAGLATLLRGRSANIGYVVIH
jgi:hypothetical protein